MHALSPLGEAEELDKVALGLIRELVSIRDELGSAIPRIDGEGKADVVHAYHRLADLTANATLVAGQLNVSTILALVKRKVKGRRL